MQKLTIVSDASIKVIIVFVDNMCAMFFYRSKSSLVEKQKQYDDLEFWKKRMLEKRETLEQTIAKHHDSKEYKDLVEACKKDIEVINCMHSTLMSLPPCVCVLVSV